MSRIPRVSFSHVGLHVRDVEKMRDFYVRTLGFVENDRGELGATQLVFLSRDPREHHQIALVSGRDGDARVVHHLSFRVESLDDLRAVKARVEATGSRTLPGDHGNAWTVYASDPEGNTLEFFLDTPWYVKQPRMEPIDLSLPDDEIARRTLARIEGDPSFKPIGEWSAELARKIEAAADEA
jgi:catechol 2,3-dioxygenase